MADKQIIPPKHDLDAKWDACLDLTVRRFVYSPYAGAFVGLLFFSQYLVSLIHLFAKMLIRHSGKMIDALTCFVPVLSRVYFCVKIEQCFWQQKCCSLLERNEQGVTGLMSSSVLVALQEGTIRGEGC
ncbi:unnamed protein product [Sphenostylis stenocarpa]|uniref:Uncharacterized protein n=1 Tax=Sphenostylis stenocarpa TaxID=92480 RepID=A0AA86SXG2_9FABA|nr:unnamed protein product [Sphenostylis stenocarpa]